MTLDTTIVAGDAGHISDHIEIAKYAYLNVEVADLVEPIYISHRGGRNVFPENTMYAFRGSAGLGMLAIEPDCVGLKDGTVGVMHDTTVDAMTSSSGAVSLHSASSWQNLTVDSSSWFGGSFGDTTPAFWEQVVAELGGKVVLVPEIKNTAAGEPLLDSILKHGLKRSVLVQSFTQSDLTPFAAEGVECLMLASNGSSLDANALLAAGINYCGFSASDTSDATVSSLVASGIKCIAYTVNRQYRRDELLALGVHGMFTDEPLYVGGGTRYLSTTDAFASGTYYHGHLMSTGSNRGVFKGTDRWGFNANPGGSRRVALLGAVSPVANKASSYTISLTLTFDAAPTDKTRFLGVGVGFVKDLDWNDGDAGTAAGSNGYHAFLRANAELVVGRVDEGTFTSLANNFSGDADLSDGSAVPITLAVTPTTITFTRTDTGRSLQVTDSTYRGGYVYLTHGHSADTVLAGSFSGVTIT